MTRFVRSLVVALALCAVSLASAQPKPDGEGFVPVAPNEQLSPSESLPGNGLLGAAYGVILAALVVWIGSVAARARKVELEMEALRKKIG